MQSLFILSLSKNLRGLLTVSMLYTQRPFDCAQGECTPSSARFIESPLKGEELSRLLFQYLGSFFYGFLVGFFPVGIETEWSQTVFFIDESMCLFRFLILE